MENPIKMDDLGVPLFLETSIHMNRFLAGKSWVFLEGLVTGLEEVGIQLAGGLVSFPGGVNIHHFFGVFARNNWGIFHGDVSEKRRVIHTHAMSPVAQWSEVDLALQDESQQVGNLDETAAIARLSKSVVELRVSYRNSCFIGDS